MLFSLALALAAEPVHLFACLDGTSVLVATIDEDAIWDATRLPRHEAEVQAAWHDGEVVDLADGWQVRGGRCDQPHTQLPLEPGLPVPAQEALAALVRFDQPLSAFQVSRPLPDLPWTQAVAEHGDGTTTSWSGAVDRTLEGTGAPTWWRLEEGEPASWLGFAPTRTGGWVIRVADGELQWVEVQAAPTAWVASRG